jgi:hypothetical protein
MYLYFEFIIEMPWAADWPIANINFKAMIYNYASNTMNSNKAVVSEQALQASLRSCTASLSTNAGVDL